MLLPISREEMAFRDWYYLDFVLISADAYVDHYSFAAAIIGRWLEHLGYRVGIIPQPDWNDPESVKALGKPRYGFLISGGNMDSMVNHYTATKKRRREDLYSPGGKRGMRPDYATTVYTKLVKAAYPELPVIIGGVEASLRRFAHYDFWQDKVLPSMLVDSGADLLVYGMGELPLKEIAATLAAGGTVADCRRIPGVCYLTDKPPVKKVMEIPSYRQVRLNKRAFAQAFNYIDLENNFYDGRTVVQRHDDIYLVANPPQRPLTTAEMDEIYEMPFENRWHPIYDADGGIPAFKEVEFSLLSHRGCFGGCAFCAINFHQGKVIQNRSDKSLIEEAKKLTERPGFKGYIHDVGGPTANFRNQGCDKAKKRGTCRNKQCLYPTVCKNLHPNQQGYIKLLKDLRNLPGVKKVFIRSGLRYDFILADRRNDFFKELVANHVSGHLKIAPEHCSEQVLSKMEKPPYKLCRIFTERFNKETAAIGKKQYVLPYFIAAHPGSDLNAAIELAVNMKNSGFAPEQVQLFMPTPGSRSTCMYYTGLDPRDLSPVHVTRSEEERNMQRALLQWKDSKNWPLIRKALRKAGREDLIGYGPQALVPPERDAQPGKKSAAKTAPGRNQKDSPKANTRETGRARGYKDNGYKRDGREEKRDDRRRRR